MRRHVRSLGRLVLLSALLLGLTAATATGAQRWLLPPVDDGVLTLLLLGSDGGPPRTDHLASARADGFQLLFVSGDRQHATFVSIPRDAWVPIPGWRNARISACLTQGPQRCVDTVEANFGIEVDGYLLTSMRGFSRAVTAFGGIEVDVGRNLVVGDTHVAPGLQRLPGPEALVYARDRKSRPDGDFGRSRAQAELLSLAHAAVAAEGGSATVLEALAILRRHSITDLAPGTLVRLGFEALRLPPDGVERHLAPARLGMAGAASVAYLDAAAYELVTDAAADGRVDRG